MATNVEAGTIDHTLATGGKRDRSPLWAGAFSQRRSREMRSSLELMDEFGPWKRRSVSQRYDNPWISVEHHEVLTPRGSDAVTTKVIVWPGMA